VVMATSMCSDVVGDGEPLTSRNPRQRSTSVHAINRIRYKQGYLSKQVGKQRTAGWILG